MRQVRSITATLVALVALGTASAAHAAQSPAKTEPSPAVQGITTGVSTVRELPELRTADSDTYLQSDGSRRLQIADHPINYQHDGAWQPIEDRLVQASDGSWEPAASPIPVSLPVGLAGQAVKIGAADRQLSLTLEGTEGASGVTKGNERSFLNVRSGVDVGYAATASSVRETVTLSSDSAPSEYKYSLGLSEGMWATLNVGGGVAISDSQGHTIYTIAAPTIDDSAPGSHMPWTAPVHYELNDAGTVLTLVVDHDWLTSSARVFPVRIDPDVYFGATKDCPIVNNGLDNTELCGSPLYVGYNSGANEIGRALLHYDLSSVPRGSQIISSSIAMWLNSTSTSTPVEIEAYGVALHAFTSKVTWNKYDGTHAWATPGGDHLKTLAGSRLVKPEYAGGWVSIGFSPQVEQWVRDPTSNFGILLKAHSETTNAVDEFIQSENGESAPEPDINIIYEPQMGNPPNESMFQEQIGNNGTLGVNVANGGLHITDPDIDYSAEGYETELARSYNSYEDELSASSVGGWRLNMGEDELLYPAWWDGSNAFHEPDGSYTRFDRAAWADNHPATGDKAYTGDAYRPETLITHENGTRTLNFNDTGIEWQFDSSENGFPQKIVDPGGEGNTISMTYTSSKLTKVTDTHGHELKLTRDPTSHNVTKIKGSGSEEWKYTYNGAGYLTKYKGPGGQEAEYTYGGPYGLLLSITDPTGKTVIAYDENAHVSSLRHVVNGTLTTIGSEDEITTFSYEEEQTMVTDPEGALSHYYYDKFGNRIEEPATQEDAASFYAEYAGIEPEAAHKDIDLQDHAIILDSQLSTEIGAGYTGEWFNPVAEKIEIGITSEGYEQTVEQDLGNLGLADNAEIVPETYSIPQLEEDESALSASLAETEEAGLISVGIEPEINKVVVEEGTSLSIAQKHEVEVAITTISVPVHVVNLTRPTAELPPQACQRGSCGKPLRGGVRIISETGQCTAGFNATADFGNPKKHYVITAGHCLSGHLGDAWGAKLPHSGETEKEVHEAGITAMGPAVAYIWGSKHAGVTTTAKGDMGLIEESPGGEEFWKFSPDIVTWARSELEPFGVVRNEHYVLFGTGYSETDGLHQFVVCLSGVDAIEGPQEVSTCGKEKGLHDEPEGSGVTVHNLERVDVCGLTGHTTQIREGASGAPVYKDGVAYGILSGANSCAFSYEGINRIENDLHVQILKALS
jgi:YD repeat-containing protein